MTYIAIMGIRLIHLAETICSKDKSFYVILCLV